MAELIVDGDELVVRMTKFEKAEAVHGEVRVPLASVKGVEVLDDAMKAVHGIRVGTGVPGRVRDRHVHLTQLTHLRRGAP